MKHTKSSFIFFILQIVCFLIVPVIFIWLQTGGLAKGYKFSVTAIISLVIVFLMFKKLMLNAWLKKIDSKVTQIEVNQLSATDASVIESLKKKYRLYSMIQLIINVIVPIACLVLFILTIKVVEAGLIKLYGCLSFSAVSMAIGVIFKVAEIYTVRCEHEV